MAVNRICWILASTFESLWTLLDWAYLRMPSTRSPISCMTLNMFVVTSIRLIWKISLAELFVKCSHNNLYLLYGLLNSHLPKNAINDLVWFLYKNTCRYIAKLAVCIWGNLRVVKQIDFWEFALKKKFQLCIFTEAVNMEIPH